MNSIKIGGIEKFSVVDFPNSIAAVVFMQGCPWRCPFCYNTHLQELGKEEGIIWSDFLEFLHKRKAVLDGVAFSGGEPLMQDALGEAMDDVIALGYKVGLHTGGYRPEMLAKVLDKVTWVGLDIKAPLNDEHYKRAVGCNVNVANILKSLDLLLASGKEFETRTTCDPRLLSIDDVYKIADFLKSKGVKNYHLQKYRPIPSDKFTDDSECEKFFQDKELVKYLQSNFEVFDLRK